MLGLEFQEPWHGKTFPGKNVLTGHSEGFEYIQQIGIKGEGSRLKLDVWLSMCFRMLLVQFEAFSQMLAPRLRRQSKNYQTSPTDRRYFYIITPIVCVLFVGVVLLVDAFVYSAGKINHGLKN